MIEETTGRGISRGPIYIVISAGILIPSVLDLAPSGRAVQNINPGHVAGGVKFQPVGTGFIAVGPEVFQLDVQPSDAFRALLYRQIRILDKTGRRARAWRRPRSFLSILNVKVDL